MKLRQILVTSDLSDESVRAFAPVASLARETGASIVLLHVVEDVPIVPYGAPLAGPLPSADLGELTAAAKQALEGQKQHFEGLTVRCEVRSSTSAAETIADTASDLGVDMIALSSHGRTGLRRLVLGSVAEAVVRHAHVPVLVFPPKA